MGNDSIQAINDIVTGAEKKEEQQQPAAAQPAEEKVDTENNGNGQPAEQGDAPNGEPAATQPAAAPINEPAAKDRLDALLEELGVKDVEGLRALKANVDKVGKTPEEKAHDEAVFKKNFELFAVREKLMDTADFITHANVTAQANYDLVFKNYLEDWKAENEAVIKENGNASEEELVQLAKIDFETEFKLNSDSAKAKERGERKLASEAEALRSPVKSKYDAALQQFKEQEEMRVNLPKFVKATEGIITGLIKDEIEWYKGKDGETEFSVAIKVPEDKRKEIADYVAKKLDNPQTFMLYQQGKTEEIAELAEALVEAKVSKIFRQEAAAEIAKKHESIGIKKGSNGSVNSFAMNKNDAADKQQALTEEQKVLDSFKK